jgi:hypothetical protein
MTITIRAIFLQEYSEKLQMSNKVLLNDVFGAMIRRDFIDNTPRAPPPPLPSHPKKTIK